MHCRTRCLAHLRVELTVRLVEETGAQQPEEIGDGLERNLLRCLPVRRGGEKMLPPLEICEIRGPLVSDRRADSGRRVHSARSPNSARVAVGLFPGGSPLRAPKPVKQESCSPAEDTLVLSREAWGDGDGVPFLEGNRFGEGRGRGSMMRSEKDVSTSSWSEPAFLPKQDPTHRRNFVVGVSRESAPEGE
ncbi:hypothetical protein T484DRAFT_1740924 [Baffinella frigidus]|nr:hypothetical protein T484DRAFT_1740924 [Cryptophyta sp. CCMP2293]